MITTNGSLPTVYAIPHLPQLVQGFWLPATTVGVEDVYLELTAEEVPDHG